MKNELGYVIIFLTALGMASVFAQEENLPPSNVMTPPRFSDSNATNLTLAESNSTQLSFSESNSTTLTFSDSNSTQIPINDTVLYWKNKAIYYQDMYDTVIQILQNITNMTLSVEACHNNGTNCTLHTSWEATSP